MSKKVIGNVEVQGTSFKVNGKDVIRSVNTVPVSSTGNVYIEPADVNLDGIHGKTIFLGPGENNNIIDNSCKLARIVDSDVELNQEKQIVIPLSQVFSTWKRISNYYGNWPTYPASSSEVNSWSYNAASNTIYNGTNSTTFLGFVSPEVYTKYELEVQITSSDADDDYVGLILAYTEINGIQYSIYAWRRLNSINDDGDFNGGGVNRGNPRWAVSYNFLQGANTGAQEYIIANGSSFVPGAGGNNWNNYGNGIRMNAVRDGDIITVNVTNLNTANYTYAPLVIDLNSDPRLYKFKNPSSIGYGTYSQARSTFRNIKFSGDKNIIYDTVDNSVWFYTNNAWQNTGSNMYDLLPSGALYSNPNTNRLFYINNNQSTTAVAGLSVGTGAGQVPSMLNFDYSSSPVGYQRLPNGLMMQWVTVNSTGTSATVNFPQPFSTKILSAYCSSNVDSQTQYNQYTVNTSSSDISKVTVNGKFVSTNSVTSSGVINCKVFAIGY